MNDSGIATTFASVPEPGQLVEVRRRQWVVNETQGAALPARSNGEQHLVTLSSLDEDALGESLQVVWQLEPGARILERADLPSEDWKTWQRTTEGIQAASMLRARKVSRLTHQKEDTACQLSS